MNASKSLLLNDHLREAFSSYERDTNVKQNRLACILGIVFMPAGLILDWFVYPKQLTFFLQLRLLCSGLLGIVLWALKTPWGNKHYRFLGFMEVSLPIFFIAWMIYATEGANSPYYAGINLVVMIFSIILRWNILDSIVTLIIAWGLYLIASLASSEPINSGIFFNNIYFLVVTGVFTVAGTFFYKKLQFQEFTSRYKLDENKRELEAANQKLIELDQVKSRFFANVSHELRTPLTLLLAPLDKLRGQKELKMIRGGTELVEIMYSNAMRLLKLINDLLDLVKLESGRMEIKQEPVEVEKLVLGILTSIKKMAEDKMVQVKNQISESLGWVKLDRDKFEKILLNLVFNSLKFTAAGGSITVKLFERADQLVLQVIDTGMGIAKEHLPHIFERFWQADSSSRRKYQGTGIGLALIKELVEAQGGEITVKSELGKGTEMTVCLPLEKGEVSMISETSYALPEFSSNGEQGEETAVGALPSEEWLVQLHKRAELFPAMVSLRESMKPVETNLSSNRPKILVADDEPDMLRFIKSQLQSRFQIIEATNGQQAIEKAQQFLPDLIVLDMMMPIKDGVQVCQELREKISTRHLPIILVTARADEETKLAALSAGATDFLTKPFSLTELLVRCENLMASYRLQKEIAQKNQELEAALEQIKEAEAQLVQSAKMASLGRMSAGLIHEINNPLNYANSAMYVLKKELVHLPENSQEKVNETLNDVNDAIQRVRNIVTNLRGFTHPDTESFSWVYVQDIFDEAIRFINPELHRDNIKTEVQVAKDWEILGNKNQLIHLMINLLQNAIDSMKEKKYPEGEVPALQIQGGLNGSNAISIRDNGLGIKEENREKIFDPFFTTKDVGAGMGLGLSICYRIIHQHQARVRIESEVGEFCEFIIEFPSQNCKKNSIESGALNV